MSIGLLGQAESATDTLVTVYTVPSVGVSHAVVHITLCYASATGTVTAQVNLNGSALLAINTNALSYGNYGVSTSMMLSPGDVLEVKRGTCAVSGYEVSA